MYKEYFHDLFTEGFGDIFFMKIYKRMLKIKNNYLKKSLIYVYSLFYLAFLAIIGYIIFRFSFPL